MYLEHFNLQHLPFGLTPDTSLFMNRAGYQDALNVLLVALRSGEGFVKVTGEVGVGKTMLCRKLLNTIGLEYATAYIHNPYLTPDSLLRAVADDLKVSYDSRCSTYHLIQSITQHLIDLDRAGRRVLICLDEAQAMPRDTLETLRLLTNLETEKRKLLQVVLFGQPELDVVLSQGSIRQLKQRITFSYELLPLNEIGLVDYVNHRLSLSALRQSSLFNERALQLLYEASAGIPRVVNILCHKALMVAFGEVSREVTKRHMIEAVADTTQARLVPRDAISWSRIVKWCVYVGVMLAASVVLTDRIFSSLGTF